MKKLKLAYLGSGPISNFHLPALKKVGFEVITLFTRKNSIRSYNFSKTHNLPVPELNFSDFLKKAEETYNEWCIENNIICEFIRFHPLKNNHINCKYPKVIFERDNKCTILSNIKTDLSNFNPKVRNKIRKVQKNEVLIEISKSREVFENFKKLYCQNMMKLKADDFYLFDEMYFDQIFNLIVENGFLVSAIDKNKNFLGASIFLYFDSYMHYHLSAITNKANVPGINNALLLAAYNHGKKLGIEICNLGGGISKSDSDSLLEFKTSMSNKSTKFYIGYKIYNKDLYNKIMKDFKIKNPKKYLKNSNKILGYRY